VPYVDIVYEKEENGIAWITVNRPHVYNAMRARTNQELVHALRDAGSDNDVRVVVLSGTGPNAFGAGQDQSFDNPDPTDEVGHTQADATLGGEIGNVSQVVRDIPQPVIAMVDGFVIGASHILAYHCDLTIASERSTFGQTGPRVGSPAAGHGVSYLASAVGQKKAREIWYTSRQYTASDALQMGLCNSVVHHDKLEEEVRSFCADIINNSPIILQMEKIGFNEYADLVNPEKSPFQRYYDKDYSASDESVERRSAFLERRAIDQSKNIPYAKIPTSGE